jgi:hypothetical protein
MCDLQPFSDKLPVRAGKQTLEQEGSRWLSASRGRFLRNGHADEGRCLSGQALHGVPVGVDDEGGSRFPLGAATALEPDLVDAVLIQFRQTGHIDQHFGIRDRVEDGATSVRRGVFGRR